MKSTCLLGVVVDSTLGRFKEVSSKGLRKEASAAACSDGSF